MVELGERVKYCCTANPHYDPLRYYPGSPVGEWEGVVVGIEHPPGFTIQRDTKRYKAVLFRIQTDSGEVVETNMVADMRYEVER